MTGKRKPKSAFNSEVFAQTGRDPVSPGDVEAAMRQIMGHSAKPQQGSENREPTKKEIRQRWKIIHRK